MDLGTGGRRETDAAILRSAGGRTLLAGRIGALSSAWDIGGPLDAPEVLPSGAMNRTEWVNGRGDAIVHQSECHRN